ncbi:hypothetical protein IX51_05645 [uncultured archaeon]|nr:hypothetical protein IX51_05645 [uncultured archaeon]
MAEDEQQQYDPMYEINYMRSLLESIDNQMNTLSRGLEELKRAFYVLKDQNIETSPETRVSIGAGIFANAKVETEKDLLVPIGSSIYVEENKDKTIERLDNNIKEVENSLTGMGNQRAEISNRYQTLLSLVQQQGSGEDQE